MVNKKYSNVMQDYQCKICGNSLGNQPMIVREMMFNFLDEFVYFKCSACGCLQITEPPENLSKYYPADKYYSYHRQFTKGNVFTNIARRLLTQGYQKGLIPSWFPPLEGSRLRFLKNVGTTFNILDIGCGNGE